MNINALTSSRTGFFRSFWLPAVHSQQEDRFRDALQMRKDRRRWWRRWDSAELNIRVTVSRGGA